MNKVETALQFFTKISFRGPIGFFIVLAGFSFLFTLLYKTVPDQNRDIVNVAAGIVLGCMKDVVGFFFGSSKDKADSDKAQQIKEIVSSDNQNSSI